MCSLWRAPQVCVLYMLGINLAQKYTSFAVMPNEFVVTEKLDLTITLSTTSTTTISAIGSYTWALNNVNYTISDNYSVVNGCDTQILALTILPIDNTTIGVLTANATDATYQWIDCGNNQPIAGETNQSFTQTALGDYQVAITVNGVSSLSACVNVIPLGVKNENSKLGIQLYPNPSKGTFYLKSPFDLEVAVYNDLGQFILSQKSFTGVNVLDLSMNASGIYFIRVIEASNVNTYKVIKN
ncbi:MAG: hypothetical protein CFE24_01705 [Flavobacterium sp. BFFFF2]|nr:MAG: hypothetical protein CFE24_01705 [Flavobacterium sp. BFFFF2]